MPDLTVEEPELVACDQCGTEYRDEDDAYYCCRFSCPSCGGEWRSQEEADECCLYQCPQCGSSYSYEEDARDCCYGSSFSGHIPVLPDADPYRVEVQDLIDRPARLCSLEQELERGGGLVAATLHHYGLSDRRSVDSYHSSSSPRTIHVEEDGSLPSDGGEVVYDRFNLSNADDASFLSKALMRIRQLRDSGEGRDRPVRTGFAAGIHVHVAARAVDGTTFAPRDISALYELWCYAEDMLYSLSASGWNRHRQPADAYGGYCKPVPKANVETPSPRTVWQWMSSDRYYGLNFQHLFRAADRCSCGAARMGDWQSCDCGAFDRATIEWRVFNASTLPRTIHAWLLMAHAMTAHAARHEIGTLPKNDYGSTTASEKREVLEHLLRVLPLTDGEREVIREAADRSPGL